MFVPHEFDGFLVFVPINESQKLVTVHDIVMNSGAENTFPSVD
jgi:hypothetical protein